MDEIIPRADTTEFLPPSSVPAIQARGVSAKKVEVEV
jgi:hypothetical protein